VSVKPADLLVGRVYRVHHSRKGTFTMRILTVDDEWVSGELVDGIANAIVPYNVRGPGEKLTIRDSHALFYGPLEESDT